MAQATNTIDFRAVYYAALRPAVTLPTRPFTTTTDWPAAGWTKLEEPDGDGGAIFGIESEMKDNRPAGTMMPISQHETKGGLSMITLRTARTDETSLLLALPDGALDGEMVTGDGVIAYRQMVIITDNNVYWGKKVSASGNVPIEHKNDDFAYTPFEFRAFEDNDNDPTGTKNYGIFKMLS